MLASAPRAVLDKSLPSVVRQAIYDDFIKNETGAAAAYSAIAARVHDFMKAEIQASLADQAA